MELSSDMQTFISSGGRCPKCRRGLGRTPIALQMGPAAVVAGKIALSDGRSVKDALPHLVGPKLSVYPHRSLGESLQCTYCYASWNVWSSNPLPSAPQISNEPTPQAPRTRQDIVLGQILSAMQARMDFSNSSIVKISETSRMEEPIGEERYIFGQKGTTASAVETIGLSHTAEWTVTVDTARARTLGGSTGLGVSGLASIRGTIEASLTEKYSDTWKQSTSRQQTTAVSVPAGKKIRVTVRWKRIWQEGEITLRKSDGTQATVPFRVTVMLGFDQEIVDLR